MKRNSILVRWQCAGIHRWVDCDIDECSYLKEWHRHVFHFDVSIGVKDLDRQIEFIVAKGELERLTAELLAEPIELSCESIADLIVDHLCLTYGYDKVYSVMVTEDNENGGLVEWQP